MLRIKLIAIAALAAFIIVPSAYAGEGAPKVSYSAKKQGRVAFQKTTQEETTAAQDTEEGTHLADIEPAAGGAETEEEGAGTNTSSLTQSMRLPRKNN